MARRKAQAAPVPNAPEPATARQYRVRLNCPTPLAHRELTVEARNKTEAQAKFMAANGISGSSHNWTVEEVAV